jgi:hypothetical protein
LRLLRARADEPASLSTGPEPLTFLRSNIRPSEASLRSMVATPVPRSDPVLCPATHLDGQVHLSAGPNGSGLIARLIGRRRILPGAGRTFRPTAAAMWTERGAERLTTTPEPRRRRRSRSGTSPVRQSARGGRRRIPPFAKPDRLTIGRVAVVPGPAKKRTCM